MSLVQPTLPSAPDLINLATYYQTHPLPQTFNAGIVVASIVASFLGAETTLLLLSRRTSTAGARNWIILVLAATIMSSVGIWGMHFIGMNISLSPAPGIHWYIQFSPGFTILSLFVPMLSLVFAFVFIGAGADSLPVDDREDGDEPHREIMFPADGNVFQRFLSMFSHCFRERTSEEYLSLRIVIGGLIVGGTVALMHYSAGFSASFQRQYDLPYLVFSIVLACVASTLSLLVFFRFQAQWQANWWKKMICALGLAVGVSGMHYLGLAGTRWYVPHGKTQGFTQGKKASTVLTIAISVMCFGVCVVSFIIVFSDFLVTRENRRKARRVTIASATFDKAGRVLVNLDGMLPMSEVETDFPLKDIIDELNHRQPTFQWLYSLSWDWSILDPFLPRIASRALGLNSPILPSNSTLAPRIFRSRKEPGSSYTSSKNAAQLALFKDRCLETTQALANQLGLPVNQMGVFFDNILRTGTRSTPAVSEKPSRAATNDEESSMYSVAIPIPRQQGVMLFLVRELSGEHQDTMDSYLKRGYRFTDTRWFAPVLADRAALDKTQVNGLLDQLKLYAKRGTKPCVRSGGIYVGIFAVRPSISREGGIDTLVYQFARHQIPAYRLPDVEGITDDMRSWIGNMAGSRMRDLSAACSKEVDTNLPPPSGKFAEDMWIFKSSLILAMDAMAANLKMFPDLAERCTLSAEVIEVPSSLDDSAPGASMIVFQATFAAPTRHGEELPGLCIQSETFATYVQDPAPTFSFVPYTLFSKTQMMMLRGNQARRFARECRLELMKRFPGPTSTSKALAPSPLIIEQANYSDPNEKEPVTPGHKGKWLDDALSPPSRPNFTDADSPMGTSSPLTPAQAEARQASQTHADSPIKSNQVTIKAPFGTPKRKQNNIPQPSWNTPEYEAATVPAYSPTATSSLWSPGRELVDPRLIDSPDNAEKKPARRPSTATTTIHDAGRARVQLLAATARLRSDDWPTRCLYGLEQSEAGQVLLGVDW